MPEELPLLLLERLEDLLRVRGCPVEEQRWVRIVRDPNRQEDEVRFCGLGRIRSREWMIDHMAHQRLRTGLGMRGLECQDVVSGTKSHLGLDLPLERHPL